MVSNYEEREKNNQTNIGENLVMKKMFSITVQNEAITNPVMIFKGEIQCKLTYIELDDGYSQVIMEWDTDNEGLTSEIMTPNEYKEFIDEIKDKDDLMELFRNYMFNNYSPEGLDYIGFGNLIDENIMIC